ncbi:uncharacterized protein LOC113991675 [Pipra filicauda]|uniref:Uncharacterized protein LOC113991675 n=1 Tax=Pipra filicauda TaxID=649802 RepID=A0A7R5KJR8_9PASS|nr:uncharacterized protein LOC113991675 [Pipra filicauda]
MLQSRDALPAGVMSPNLCDLGGHLGTCSSLHCLIAFLNRDVPIPRNSFPSPGSAMRLSLQSVKHTENGKKPRQKQLQGPERVFWWNLSQLCSPTAGQQCQGMGMSKPTARTRRTGTRVRVGDTHTGSSPSLPGLAPEQATLLAAAQGIQALARGFSGCTAQPLTRALTKSSRAQGGNAAAWSGQAGSSALRNHKIILQKTMICKYRETFTTLLHTLVCPLHSEKPAQSAA